MLRQVTKTTNSIFRVRAMFSEITRSRNQAPSKRQALQFSKSRLVDFGELPHGQIPIALQYSRPTTINKLSNGVRAITEQWMNGLVGISVVVGAGARQQNINNSSVSQFISRLIFHGTSSKSKSDIESHIDRLGGHVEVNVEREITVIKMLVPKDKVNEAVAFLGDVISNPTFDQIQVEAVKAQVHRNASKMDPELNTHENIHYTSFRDHFISQPTHGIKDNVYSITADQVKEFHSKYYVGDNIVVSAAGEVDSAAFNEAVNQNFGSLKKDVQGQIQNNEKPFFTPSLMFQRDDQLPNVSIGAAFCVPGWNDPDFFAFNYFKRIIGEYRIDKHTGTHLNTPKLQYNSFHTDLGNYGDIIMTKPFYFAYSDVGLFGNFLFGNEIWSRQLSLMSQNKMSEYAQDISQSQIYRARNKYWNELLTRNCPYDVSVRNARQIIYLNRLISRTQTATRISNMDAAYLRAIASKYFYDVETSIVAWGPLHGIMSEAHYGRSFRRATLGDNSIVRVKYQT